MITNMEVNIEVCHFEFSSFFNIKPKAKDKSSVPGKEIATKNQEGRIIVFVCNICHIPIPNEKIAEIGNMISKIRFKLII